MGSTCTQIADQSRDPQVDNGLSTPSFLLSSDQSFPTGVLTEILSRLPVKSLVQCQLVCKEWQALIHEPYFKEIHFDRSYFVTYWHNRTTNYPPTRIYPDPFVFLSGCKGLLLMIDLYQSKHYVWNPAIRRSLELPDPHESSKGFALSYVPTTKSYRIVSFYNSGGSLRCQIITPGNSVWRSLELPEIENNENVVKRESVIPCEGAAHYVLVTVVGEVPRTDILSLDLETESFAVSRFQDLSGEWKNCWELGWDGKLGFADVVGENLEVMVLEDYKRGRWCNKKRVIHLDFWNKLINFWNKSMAIPLLGEKGEIWFWLKDKTIFKYTVQTKRCTDVAIEHSRSLSSRVLPYKPSMISFGGMVPDSPEFDSLRSYFRRYYDICNLWGVEIVIYNAGVDLI